MLWTAELFPHGLIAGTLHLTASIRIMKNPLKNKNGPMHLMITLPKDLANWVNLHAKLRRLTAAELIIEAIWHYRESGIDDQSKITKAISEGTPKVKTGRYEG